MRKNIGSCKLEYKTAQVWIRIYGLSQEYWRPKILFAIAGSIGTPICTDAATNKSKFDRDFGHFARVLVDIDLKHAPTYRVLVERTGFAFFVDIEFENLPAYCSYCKCIGHEVSVCKRNKVPQVHDDGAPKKITRQEHKATYLVTKDNRNDQLKDTEVINLEGSTSKCDKQATNKETIVVAAENSVSKPVEAAFKETIVVGVAAENLNSVLKPVEASNADANKAGLETNLTQSDDESSCSDFVEETQIVIDDDANNKVLESSNPNTNIPHDDPIMTAEFLKNSWANMTNQAEKMDVVDDGPEANVEEQPFQKVISRKRNKKKNNNQGSRSKVGNANSSS
jgi:hypothetical protein